jgi:hypothetical protein
LNGVETWLGRSTFTEIGGHWPAPAQKPGRNGLLDRITWQAGHIEENWAGGYTGTEIVDGRQISKLHPTNAEILLSVATPTEMQSKSLKIAGDLTWRIRSVVFQKSPNSPVEWAQSGKISETASSPFLRWRSGCRRACALAQASKIAKGRFDGAVHWPPTSSARPPRFRYGVEIEDFQV